ncbi:MULTISPECIES: cation:proton antiporter [unclassified Fusibacter]|uniref:cation:proton antiporter n=1 Tax=unclassified Fusibacter TaxID=2624464 RepID=UPI001012326F|nr:MULTISPECIES: cation:proton antiporter [unclassified Fusibacter]MCK8059876.1 cation:proton antiporter [Fusibacter sp. A2]NPE21678.1 cation:proton antiporter [Fusibacter sp. A1]RXV62081.1 cation:proton antiporter [Fusibacter sp. A1]
MEKYFYLVQLAIILIAANIGGLISTRFKQPAVLGQIIVGMILGMGLMVKTEFIGDIAELGVVFLMFTAGLETDVDELKSSSKSSSMIALGGVVVPFTLVSIGTYLLTRSVETSLFMGIVSTATSVSISVQTLREIGRLRSRQGITILGAAIIDDIIGIVLLALLLGVLHPTEGAHIVLVIGKLGMFFALTYIVGIGISRLLDRFCEKLNISDHVVTYAIVLCFLLAFASEELGVAAITGAYFAGVAFSMTKVRHKVSHDINLISTTFFTPVFFVAIGMGVNLFSAFQAIGIGLILIILGSLGKVIGCGVGAKLTGFNKFEGMQIGLGMIPRAEVAIILANLGVTMNIITDKEIAGVILMVVATTLMTPSLLKWSFERESAMMAPKVQKTAVSLAVESTK